MSEERSGKEDVEKLKQDLEELIDHRIEYNNGFTNLLRGDYSLIISLIALFLSVYGAWKLGFWSQFLTRYYMLSVYLMFGIWLLYGIRGTIRAPKKREQEGVRELIRTKPEGIINWYFKKLSEIMEMSGILEKTFSWYLKWAKPLFYSLWALFSLSIPILWIIGEKRWWMWAPAILFVFFLPLIAEKGSTSFTALLDQLGYIKEKHKIEVSTTRDIVAIILILILAIIGIYSSYNILKELIFVILETPYSLLHIILTVILILVVFASLSEYLSMKFMVTDLSNQNYALFMFRTMIDRIENVKTLEKDKKELLKWYLPKADSFLVFFNYYGLMLTPHTFEVDEEEEKEQKS
jgi:hypothetical protein